MNHTILSAVQQAGSLEERQAIRKEGGKIAGLKRIGLVINNARFSVRKTGIVQFGSPSGTLGKNVPDYSETAV
jgi:hypothetical protein